MPKKLTRAGLVEAIKQEFKISVFDATELIEDILEEIQSALVDGDCVKIAGFGTFSLIDKKERLGRNPMTMEPAVITARRVVSFHTSDVLRNILNQKNIKKEGKQ